MQPHIVLVAVKRMPLCDSVTFKGSTINCPLCLSQFLLNRATRGEQFNITAFMMFQYRCQARSQLIL